MPLRIIVQVPGEPDRVVPVLPGSTAEPLPSVFVSAAEAPGVVVEGSPQGISVVGRVLRGEERRLLRPGESARVGDARIVAVGLDPGTASQARTILLAALRGEEPGSAIGLAILEGPEAGRLVPLRDGVLGRGEAANFRFADPTLSRSHVRIRVDGARVILEDLGSKNGVRVGGLLLSSPRELVPGDEARAGRTVFAIATRTNPTPEVQDLSRDPTVRPPARSLRSVARGAALAAGIAAAAAAALLAL